MLVELLVDAVHGRVLATDLSPRTLRRVRAAYGVGVAALDARQMPFGDGVVPTMTTFVGIANVEQPGELMRELRRVVGRRLLAICSFYPEGDGNADAIAATDSGLVLYREPFLRGLGEAGFDVRVLASCAARAEPTPRGVLLEGATIDALPVVATDLEWALVEAW